MQRLAILVATLSLTLAGAAGACPGKKAGHHGKGMHGGGPLLNAPAAHLQKHLELNDEQVAKLGEITSKLKAAAATDREAIHAVHVELRNLWSGADVPAREAVVELQTKLREHRDHLGGLVLTARLEATAVLTSTQRQTLGSKRGGHACGGQCKGGHGKEGHGKEGHGEGRRCPHSKGE